MELTQLKYFLAVAESGSISSAARMVEAKQPTLSVSLRNLEEELGTTLFHRDSRGVSLTEAGREFRSAVQEVFETLGRAQERLSGLQNEDTGRFTIGCNEALGAYFLPTFMASFMRAAPSIELSLRNGTSAETREAVLDRSADFGLCDNPEPHPDLVIVKLYRDGIEAYVAASEPERPDLRQACQRLRAGPLIASGRMPQVRDLMARFRSDDVLPERILDCGDHQLVRALTSAGLGVGLMPRRVATHGGPGTVRRLHRSLPGFPDLICLLYRADLHRTRAAMKLKEALVVYGRALQAEDPNEGSILPP